jgi:N-acetyl sugar amidotransferase
MIFCQNCIIPTTRPQVSLEKEGLCTACKGSMEKSQEVDWESRSNELEELLRQGKSQDGGTYDCLIPVSGGKDSTWQVHTLINKYGLRPLTMTWKPRLRTDIGTRNLENLIELGVDHMDFTCNPKIERKFMLRAFEQNGSPSLSEHMAMYSMALRTAMQNKIKIIVWGENPGAEYGGSKEDRLNAIMNRDWISKYGVSNGTFAEDWMDEDLDRQNMLPYTFPTDEEMNKAQVRPIFLGWYLRWDPLEVAMKAQEVGFEWGVKPQTGYYRYADLDAPFVIVHHMFKWYKFGFTRLWDNLSIEIRNGRLTRDDAIGFILENPEPIPITQIHQLCQYLRISETRFWEIVEKHRNLEVWKKDSRGSWTIPAIEKEFGAFPRNYEELP